MKIIIIFSSLKWMLFILYTLSSIIRHKECISSSACRLATKSDMSFSTTLIHVWLTPHAACRLDNRKEHYWAFMKTRTVSSSRPLNLRNSHKLLRTLKPFQTENLSDTKVCSLYSETVYQPKWVRENIKKEKKQSATKCRFL